ncbi:MAG: hypothetical protein ABIJ96_16675 [Elusimicrobiota bacterium]
MNAMTSAVLSLALLAARECPAAVRTELGGYDEGQNVAGYRVQSLYLDAEGEPMGARYVHPNGMVVDILRVASVPQVSLNVGTLPTSDMGEPHTQEHLLLGKGKVGQYFNSLISMSLGAHTAATHQELTNYQFNSAGDKETFYRLLRQYLRALILPDYSDEEIRREVAHIGTETDAGTGKLRLEEKGSVYLEMISSMEKAQWVNWEQLKRQLYGAGHPLARNQGGAPDDIRRMKPADIRRFHAANYHFGSNLSIIAALPPDYPQAEFLTRLSAVMEELEPAAVKAQPGCRPGGGECGAYASLPPFAPAEGAPIVIGKFPSAATELPQEAVFSWKPLPRTPTMRERLELTLFLSVLADGDTSVLYRVLVDGKTRELDSGAANIGSYFTREPGNVPLLFLTGLPSSKLTPEHLGVVREAVLRRVAALEKAGRRSPELKEFNQKALSLLSSWRRSMLKFIDSPPRFGFRHGGTGWHQHLDELARAKGFRKNLAEAAVYDEIEGALRDGKNIWQDVIRSGGLREPMIVSAVVPAPELLAADRAAKLARMAQAAAELKKLYKLKDEQAVFARHAEEYAQKTAELKARDASIGSPQFVDQPPLTLDESIDVETRKLGGRVPAVISRFPSTPFTDIHLFFNLRGVPEADWLYLPAFSRLLTEMGAATAGGEKLDYVGMEERWRSEIYALSARIVSDPRTRRLELSISASGAGPAEIRKSADWIESALRRSDISAATAGRLRDLLRDEIQSLTNLFQSAEEEWAESAADAYLHQRDPQWMSVRSPLTRLHLLHRLYFRLTEYPDAKTRLLAEQILDDLLADTGERQAPRERMADRFSRLASGAGLPPTLPASRFLREFGSYFSATFRYLPETTWRRDIERLIRETKEDVGRPPAGEMKHMKGMLRGILTRGNMRVAITGTEKNAAAAAGLVETFIKKLQPGAKVKNKPLRQTGVVTRRLQERIKGLAAPPVHVGLVNNDAKSGVFVLSADGPAYGDADRDSVLDYLAAEVFAGGAPHSFFMKTWSAGLAYSNGTRPSPSRGRVLYYAERCSDLSATMRFVSQLAKTTALDTPAIVEHALANAFSDYRGAATYSARGAAMAADFADGRSPQIVRRFKKALVAAAKADGALKELKARLPRVLGSVLVGYGIKMKDAPGASGFVIGPDGVLKDYEQLLKKNGEADGLVRLYPRDFWIVE